MQRDDSELGLDPADVERIRRIMSELADADFERLEPPADVWAGIEARAESMRARQAPSQATSAQLVVEYEIDTSDVLTPVGAGWADFARANGAAALASPASDRTLWSYIDRSEIVEVWQLLVTRVRATQQQASVPFRCDAPHARRWFEMTITPEPDGHVRFRSALVFEEERRPVLLLDPAADRDADARPIPLCSWCGRGQLGQRWLDIEELVRADRLLESESIPPISHGICAPCRDEMAAELLVPSSTDTRP